MIQQKDYSWIFTTTDDVDPAVVGHVRLTPSVSTTNDIQGSAPCGVLTSVVVDPNLRGRGIGMLMMRAIETEAIKQGYYQLHLWTYDAVEFYRKLGYSVSEERRALNTMAFAFESVNRSTLNSLENLLARKLEAVQTAATQPIVVTTSRNMSSDDIEVPRPSGTGGKGNPIWMRKRVVDEVPLEPVAVATVLAQIRRTLSSTVTAADIARGSLVDVFLHVCKVSERAGGAAIMHTVQHFHLDPATTDQQSDGQSQSAAADAFIEAASANKANVVNVANAAGNASSSAGAQSYLPWSHQVGPSCGIQALRFAEHILFATTPLGPLIDNAAGSSTPRSVVDESKATSVSATRCSDTCAKEAAGGRKTLLQQAVECEYTTDGDIYNIHHMCALAQMLPNRAGHGGSEGIEGIEAYVQCVSDLSCADLCNMLLGSTANPSAKSACIDDSTSTSTGCVGPALLIFPYDRDDTQSTPCCKQGVAAHYALICGFILLPGATGSDPTHLLSSTAEQAEQQHTHGTSSMDTKSNVACCDNRVSTVPSDVDPARVLLVAMHGLSSKPIVAPYSEWAASNAQLHCASAKPSSTSRGSSTGAPSLRGNCVVLRRAVSL